MKDILRLPVLFLFFFVLLFLFFLGLSLLAQWGSVYSEGREIALQVVEARMLQSLLNVLPAAVLVSLAFLLARIATKPGSRFLSLIIPLGGAFVLLAFGYQILAGLGPLEGAQPSVIDPTPRRYLAPGVFNATESKVLYFEDLEERRLSSVVVAERGSSDQKLLYFPQGQVAVGEESVILRMAGYTLEMDPEPVYAGMFAEDPILWRFFTDLDFLNRELRRMFQLSLPSFYFAVLALVISFYAIGMFFRLTRWHLLNAALTLLALRGFLALFRFMKEGVVFELDKVLRNPQALQFLPELALLTLGGLLLLLDILFVPFNRWEEG
ncbi:MAG: hypothetical protein V3V57_05510 [Spirochaetia bacterium]